MTVEPREPDTSSGMSPYRWLLVIVPVLVIAVFGSNLLGLWAMSSQQAARDERLRQAEREAQRQAPEPAAGNPGRARPDDRSWLEKLLPRGGETEGDGAAVYPPPEPIDPSPGGVEAPAETAPAGFDAAAVAALLPAADPAKGAAVFRICAACHSDGTVAPGKIGPNLWGIAGRGKASRPDYRYSAGLKAKGGTWTTEDLAQFIHNPRATVPGTSMAFRGIAENERIADLIAYLRTLSNGPAARRE